MLFTFPSRYYPLSVAISYLALEGGPPRFRQDFSCPVLLRKHADAASYDISPTGLSPSLVGLPSALQLCQEVSPLRKRPYIRYQHAPTTSTVQRCKPSYTPRFWAVPRSLATTRGIAFCFLFLQVLRWFSSLGIAPSDYFVHLTVAGIPTGRVTPFGHLRICGCLLLPAAFRSLPRPSSPDSSKASTVDPYSLDHITSCPFPTSPRGTLSVETPARLLCQRSSCAVPPFGLHRHSPPRPLRRGIISQISLARLRALPSGGKGIRTPDLWLAKPPL